MPVLTRSIVGYFSVSKKSAVFRWASRVASPVETDVTSALASTFDFNGSSAIVIVPLKVPNRPRTLLTMRCRETNPTEEWTGSTFQMPGVRSLSADISCAPCRVAIDFRFRLYCDHKDYRRCCLRTQ